MKKVPLVAVAVMAFIFAGCENKKTAPNDSQADTMIMMDANVDTTADSLTSEFDMQLSQNSTDAIQASLTLLQNKYAELVASGKLDTAKAHTAKIQLFLSDNVEKIKATIANNAIIVTLVSDIQNPLIATEAIAEQAEVAVKDNAEGVMRGAEFETNKTIDRAKWEAMKTTDNADARMNEAKDKAGKAPDRSAEEVSRGVNQVRGQTREGLGL